MNARGGEFGRRFGAALLLAGLLSLGACERKQPEPEATARPGAPAGASMEHPVATQPGAPPRRVVPPAPKPTGPLAPGTSCATAECHAGYATARFNHAPVASGACDSCHGEDAGGHKYPLLREANATCTYCHAVAGTRTHQHAAIKEGCTSCHQPHASDTRFLLRGATVEQTCHKCHDIPLKRHVHEPFAEGNCTLCHDPHESDNARLLRGGEGPEHCFMCHGDLRQAIAKSPVVHKPATEKCLTCHDPHTSEHSQQIKGTVQEVCFSCHKDLEEHVTRATAPHGAVFTGEQCANCHDPHAAGRTALLRAPQEDLCLRCHDKPVEATDGHTIPNMKALLAGSRFLHGPVKAGECTACHNAHGSSYSNLLRKMFTKSFYTTFDLESYALCFSCHDKALVLEEKTAGLTNFRNGEANLHYLHVHRDSKGRTCKACHAIHGSDQPRHIATDVPFEGSKYAMPIQFESATDGGRCSPGCHSPKAYNRRTPVLNPTTQPATTPAATQPATR